MEVKKWTIKVLHIMSWFLVMKSAFGEQIKSCWVKIKSFDVLTYDECSTEFIKRGWDMGDMCKLCQP